MTKRIMSKELCCFCGEVVLIDGTPMKPAMIIFELDKTGKFDRQIKAFAHQECFKKAKASPSPIHEKVLKYSIEKADREILPVLV